MKKIVVCTLLALHGLTQTALAETCVSATFDRPFPGATSTETRHADVPSPRFPGVWQEGWIDGFFYRIWSNEEAVLQQNSRTPAWTISVTCKREETQCRDSVEGTPPTSALIIAVDLGLCLSDSSYAGHDAEPPEGTSTEAGADNETSDPVDAAPCGLAKLPDGPDGLTLQKLLLEAGGDPGPLDGFIGARTRSALAEVLGASSVELSVPDAISALDAALCNGTD